MKARDIVRQIVALGITSKARERGPSAPGQALREPAPLFWKLDEGVVEEEYARLAG